jgi:cell division protein FtsQ
MAGKPGLHSSHAGSQLLTGRTQPSRRAAHADRELLSGRTRPRLRRSGRPRRRRDLALFPDLGVEVRLPSLPSVRLGRRALGAALLGGWLFVVHSAWAAPAFRVNEVEILGTELMRPEHVRSIAGVTGDRVFSVDPADIEGRLEAYAEVADAQVRVRWPNKVEIRVSERQPVLAWDDGGRVWWLSRAGVAYLAREQRDGMALVISPEPALTIAEDPMAPAVNPELVSLAVNLSTVFPSVGPLAYDPIHGLGFQDPRGWIAYFGKGGDFALKVRMYETIAESLAGQEGGVALISVEDLFAPYYRYKR